jgi:choline transport protein
VVIGTILINGTLGMVFLIMLLFIIQDMEAAVTSPTEYPSIEIFYQANGSKAGATCLTFVIIMSVLTAAGLLTSALRTTWAFARDNQLLYSEFFTKVKRLPLQTSSSSHLASPTLTPSKF